MDGGEFKAKVRRKEPVFGTWSHIPNTQVVEIIGASGLDFIVFDMEHGPHSSSEMPALYCAAESSGLVPVTRVPGLGDGNVLRNLDSGAKGIMIPHVDSAAKAARGLESIYYGDSPHSRGVATLTRSSMFDYENEMRHLAVENGKITSILMIEDRSGLACLDEICGLPDLDVVFVGIYDLSQSLGLKGSLDDPRFHRVFEDAVERIKSNDIAVGCYAPTTEGARRLVELGVSFITINVDGAMLRRSYQAVVEALRLIGTSTHV